YFIIYKVVILLAGVFEKNIASIEA
ncbi:amino acid ABC transporter permease, partial [Salmonella enterica]|nr:amino acid ABC transporter permease [Salmonella enterica]